MHLSSTEFAQDYAKKVQGKDPVNVLALKDGVQGVLDKNQESSLLGILQMPKLFAMSGTAARSLKTIKTCSKRHRTLLRAISYDEICSSPWLQPIVSCHLQNMYNDYSMVSAGLSDPFQPAKKEKHTPCNFVVSYTGENDPRFQLNNPAYMREVTRSYADNIPKLFLTKNRCKRHGQTNHRTRLYVWHS